MLFVDLGGFPWNWQHIADCPFPNRPIGPPTACVVNGYFSILYACSQGNPGTSLGVVLYSWDQNGNRCTYQTADFNPTNADRVAAGNGVFQVGNVFTYTLVNNSTIFKITIPPVFTPGATYTIPYNQLNTSPPCGVGDFHQLIYFSQQNLYAEEFIQAFPDSDNYWVSIFDGSNNFINGGYIGNAPVDPFDQIQTTLPPFTSQGDIYYKNGFNVYLNGQVNVANQYFGFNQPSLVGNINLLVCGGSGTNAVYATAINQFQTSFATNGCPGFFPGGPGSALLAVSCCDTPGFFAYSDEQFPTLLSKDFFIRMAGPSIGSNIQACYGVLMKQGKMYLMDSAFGNWTGRIRIANFSLGAFGLAPIPVVQHAQFGGLANYHRAISPNGTFQA